MIDKVLNKVCRAYLKARNKFMELANEENGMETIEVVILVAIAVVIGAFVANALTGGNGKKGIIDKLFEMIMSKLSGLLGESVPD